MAHADVQQATLFAEPFTEGALLRHTATGSLWRLVEVGDWYSEVEAEQGSIDGCQWLNYRTDDLAQDFEEIGRA